MTPQPQFIVGLDLAQDSFHAAIAFEGVEPGAWRDLPNTAISARPDSPAGVRALLKWIVRHAPLDRCAGVVVESTGPISHRVARAMADRGLPELAIVNPRRSKAFGDSLGVRDKNDRVDAAILALYGMIHRPQPTARRTKDEQELRELSRMRETVVGDRAAWSQRLDQADSALVKREIRGTIQHLDHKIDKLDQAIKKAIERQENLKTQSRALETIDGIGKVTAATLTAELGDLTRYDRNQLVAAAGLFPKEFSSGKSINRRPRLAKGGGGRVRRVLYMCATSLLRTRGPMRDLADKHLEAKRPKMVVLGILMRRLLLVARAVMKNGGVYEPDKILAQIRRATA